MIEDWDERLLAVQEKNQIIKLLLSLIYQKKDPNNSMAEGFPIYEVDDCSLEHYVTLEEDLEEGHTIRPDDSHLQYYTYESYVEKTKEQKLRRIQERRSTRTFFSKNK